MKAYTLGALIGLVLLVGGFSFPAIMTEIGFTAFDSVSIWTGSVILSIFGLFVFLTSVGVVKG